MHSVRTTGSAVKVSTASLGLIFIAVGIWVGRGYVWPTLSSVEVPTIRAMLDHQILQDDFVVQESLRFTPRYYYNHLIYLIAKTGLSLGTSFAVLHLFFLSILAWAISTVGRELRLSAFGRGSLLLSTVSASGGCLGMVFFYTHAPVPAVWAGCLALAGFGLALKKRPIEAFGVFGMAALAQFLVGFYSGIVALYFLSKLSIRHKAVAIAIWGACLACVYVPLLASVRNEPQSLTESDFVQIYAFARHPHHLVPSQWPIDNWISALAFYAGAFLIAYRPRASQVDKLNRWIFWCLAVGGFCLFINYIGVEVVHSSLVAKLQPARITPLMQTIALMAAAVIIDKAFRDRDYLLSICLLFSAIAPSGGILFLLSCICLRLPSLSRSPALRTVGHVALISCVAMKIPEVSLSRFCSWIIIILLPVAWQWIHKHRTHAIAAPSLVLTGALVLSYVSTTSNWPRQLAERFSPFATPSDGPGTLGARFGKYASLHALVLIPPFEEAWTFKLYSNRAVVVDEKDFPFTNRGIAEWAYRMKAVGGSLSLPAGKTAAWRSLKPEELTRIAEQFHATFVLTRDDWQQSLPGKRLDSAQGWSLWELASDENRLSKAEFPTNYLNGARM